MSYFTNSDIKGSSFLFFFVNEKITNMKVNLQQWSCWIIESEQGTTFHQQGAQTAVLCYNDLDVQLPETTTAVDLSSRVTDILLHSLIASKETYHLSNLLLLIWAPIFCEGHFCAIRGNREASDRRSLGVCLTFLFNLDLISKEIWQLLVSC